MELPEWNDNLELALRDVFFDAPPEGSPSRHTGLREVYKFIKALSEREVMDANSLILALAAQPGFLPVREDQAGETYDITGVDRRIDGEGDEYLVLLSAPRNKPETAPETGVSPVPQNLPYYPPGVR